jgi:ketosteroid isomerase-like protein
VGDRTRLGRAGGFRRRPLRWALAGSVLAAAAACTIERGDVRTPSGEPPEADTVRVRKLIEAIAESFGTGDLAALDTIYHDSVTVFEGGSVDRGWRAYRDGHLAPELRALSDRRLRFRDVRVHLAGSMAWATARYDLSATAEGGTVSAEGLATFVFRKRGGRWRVVHVHTSSR